ncbi:MAG: hypothetical protein ACTSWF_04135 [Candidatus Freyarchaeota archaeon]
MKAPPETRFKTSENWVNRTPTAAAIDKKSSSYLLNTLSSIAEKARARKTRLRGETNHGVE